MRKIKTNIGTMVLMVVWAVIVQFSTLFWKLMLLPLWKLLQRKISAMLQKYPLKRN